MELEYVLVPSGLLIMAAYHSWLVYTIRHNPRRTVIGLNAESRRQWVHCLMADPVKLGLMGIHGLRNNMMATTQLAMIAITLSSLITALVSMSSTTSLSESGKASFDLLGITLTYTFTHVSSKYFAVLLCFLLAFFCNMQAIRYYAHVSFLISLPSSQGKADHIEFAARHLNMGTIFWSLGIRAFYFAFPLLLWIFGCIPMFICSIIMTFVLYFSDTTNHFTKSNLNGDTAALDDTESTCDSLSSVSRNSSIAYPLLATTSR